MLFAYGIGLAVLALLLAYGVPILLFGVWALPWKPDKFNEDFPPKWLQTLDRLPVIVKMVIRVFFLGLTVFYVIWISPIFHAALWGN